MSNIFYLQNSEKINEYDLEIIRLFYAPIVGQNAICFYQLLVDTVKNTKYINEKHDFSKLSKILQLNLSLLLVEREKLEAIGLIKTYLSTDNMIILDIQKPLTINMIAKNDLMSSILIDKLGMQLFKELIESKANYVFEPNKTVEISKKFYEIYDLPNTKEQKITFNFKVNNIYEASKSLNSEKFIEYLTNNKPTTSEFMMINNLKKLKFCDAAINLFINYSMKINNLIVVKYIEKIAKDYAKRHITNANEIDAELSFALSSKMNTQKQFSNFMVANNNQTNLKFNDKDVLQLSGETDWD